MNFALELTRTPASVDDDSIARLRSAGLDDRAIHDATAIAAYYNFANRMVEALGVELEGQSEDGGAGSGASARR